MSAAKSYEWDGEIRTVAGWAEELGIQTNAFRSRIHNYGIDNPRTFHTGNLKRSEWKRGVLEGSVEHVGEIRHLHKRSAFLKQLVEEHSWIVTGEIEDGDGTMVDVRDEANEVVELLIAQLSPMRLTEIGIVMGLSRERIRQIQNASLMKMKLAGGRDLRETYEYRQGKPLVTCWDQIFNEASE